MKWYMVWGSKKRPKGFMGGTYLDWGEAPIGVYQAESPEEACKQAAADSSAMGTFFALEGYPWGLELMAPQATRLGSHDPLGDRLERVLTAFEQTSRQIEQVTTATAEDVEET